MTEQEKIKKALSGLRASGDTITEVLKMANETKIRKFTGRKIAVIAVAAAFILALGVTAYASGFAESFIAQMSGFYAKPDAARDARYAQAAELSDKEPVTVTLAERVGSAITLDESYYDGEDLMLVYSLDALKYPVEFGFGPGDEHFDDLWTPGSDYDMFPTDRMTAEERQEALRALEENGSVGFIVRYVDLGDHVTLSDGTDLVLTGRELPDGKVFLECQNGLPETAKGLDHLDVVFQVKEFVGYYYQDGAQGWCYYPLAEGEPVTFTIQNCS